MLKKPYYEKTCFFWSLYCKTLLATCWIGGFLFGCLIWIRCDFHPGNYLYSAEPVFSGGCLTMPVASLISIGLAVFIFHFSNRLTSFIYVFVRTSLLSFSMLGFYLITGSPDWLPVFLWHSLFLSLEFGLWLRFSAIRAVHHSHM